MLIDFLYPGKNEILVKKVKFRSKLSSKIKILIKKMKF